MKKIQFVLLMLCAATLQVSAQGRLSNALERRVARQPRQLNEKVFKAASNPRALGQMRRLLEQGADPCHALPAAVFSNNVFAVNVLAEYKKRCNWKKAVEERLNYVMKKDRVDMFYALMADNRGITCPDPFDFTPANPSQKFEPLSAQMLAAVNQRCFQTKGKQSAFLKNMILLNPGHQTVFALGESYKYGIRSSQAQKGWLENINQLVKANVKVSNDTLQEVISQSRVHSAYGNSNIPFDTTRQLVKLCMKGGANGLTVLHRLDQPENEWVWENYSSEERMRISNILESKPETQPRSVKDHLRGAVQTVRNWF